MAALLKDAKKHFQKTCSLFLVQNNGTKANPIESHSRLIRFAKVFPLLTLNIYPDQRHPAVDFRTIF